MVMGEEKMESCLVGRMSVLQDEKSSGDCTTKGMYFI